MGDLGTTLTAIGAILALVTALASLAGRARDKATIIAYKENADVQDRTIRNQGEKIIKLEADRDALTTRCNVLESTVNSAEKIDALSTQMTGLIRVVEAGNNAIDRHASDAESWWEQLHLDLGEQTTSISALTSVLGAERRQAEGTRDPERRER